MDDLIRRSEAESIFRSARRAMKPENYSGQEFFIRDNILLNAEQIVHSIPAVDAVEVRHGHWHTLTDCSNSGTYCSECNTKIFDFTHKPKDKLSRYCPHCGARMDGRREDGDA